MSAAAPSAPSPHAEEDAIVGATALPAPEEQHKVEAVLKVVGFNAALVAIGALLYAIQARRRADPAVYRLLEREVQRVC